MFASNFNRPRGRFYFARHFRVLTPFLPLSLINPLSE
nr:MAG TPA: hypothetical protein [Caudoviricetes sp.]